MTNQEIGDGVGVHEKGQPLDPRTQGGLQQWGSSLHFVTNLGCLLRLRAIGAPECRAAAHLVPGRLDYGRTPSQPLPDGRSRGPQVTPGTCASRSSGSAPAGHWEPEHRAGSQRAVASCSLAVRSLPTAVPGERAPPPHRLLSLCRSASHFPSGTTCQDLWGK